MGIVRLNEYLSQGVTGSVIGPYISDLFFNIFIYEQTNLLEIITNVSPTPAYIAATSSGFLNGLTAPYIDGISSLAFRNVAYAYTNDYFSRKLNESDLIDELDIKEVVQDTLAIVILVTVFSRSRRNSFLNHQLKKKGYTPIYDEQLDIFDSALIIIVINFYAYYKRQKNNLNQVDRSVDLL